MGSPDPAPLRLTVAAGDLLRVGAGALAALCLHGGRGWMTRDGDRRDWWLEPGIRCRLDDGALLLEAETAGSISLWPREASGLSVARSHRTWRVEKQRRK